MPALARARWIFLAVQILVVILFISSHYANRTPPKKSLNKIGAGASGKAMPAILKASRTRFTELFMSLEANVLKVCENRSLIE